MSVDGPSRLRAPVGARDHRQGPRDAPVVLVEYGDYECPYCRQAQPIIAALRARFDDRLAYVFRHWPISDVHPHAQHAAEAAEAAAAQGRFWAMHGHLFAHQDALDDAALVRHAATLGLDVDRFARELTAGVHAARVREDLASGAARGVTGTPTFFINGRRYDGPWDEESLQREIERPLGVQVRQLFQQFAQLQAAGGVVLLAATALALLWANLPGAPPYEAAWATELGVELGPVVLREPLRAWVNDALMALFFLVVGLEIKRELLIGELASPRRAALPVVAALGGMLVPAALYMLLNGGTPGQAGWGIPVATDIAFTLGLLTALGRRVPLALRVFFAALAIADDLGAIVVIALFYGAALHGAALGVAAALVALVVGLGRRGVQRPLPYALLGVLLWGAVFAGGLHPTLAGVLVALAVPARPHVGAQAFLAQSTAVLSTLPGAADDALTQLSRQQAAAQALETIAERLQTPAQRLERSLAPWSSYLIVPVFALANAGVGLRGDLGAVATSAVAQGIVLGLVVGKPLGVSLFAWLAVRLGLAALPAGTTWRQLLSASLLAGIGFTVSLFIADAAFGDPALLATAKLGILAGSVLAAALGAGALVVTGAPRTGRTRRPGLPPA
jgi:NhaA family Na+:H+ antiporter